MKKVVAQGIYGIGIALVILGLLAIELLFQYTYEVNSQPEPPVNVIVVHDFILCQCDVTNGLAWNSAGVVTSVGAIMIVVGIAKERLITRRGY